MQVGIVEWFDEKKGYGSILTMNKESVFVHFAAIIDSSYRMLQKGDKVKFVVVEGMNGPQAVRVQRLN